MDETTEDWVNQMVVMLYKDGDPGGLLLRMSGTNYIGWPNNSNIVDVPVEIGGEPYLLNQSECSIMLHETDTTEDTEHPGGQIVYIYISEVGDGLEQFQGDILARYFIIGE